MEIAPRQTSEGWRIRGFAQIDDRPATACVLTIRPDGTWSALVGTFTFASQVDLLVTSADGGQFCGPAFVERSRADTGGGLGTELQGVGPLLVVAHRNPELGNVEMVDGEVVDP